jgi:hypothetical protein
MHYLIIKFDCRQELLSELELDSRMMMSHSQCVPNMPHHDGNKFMLEFAINQPLLIFGSKCKLHGAHPETNASR